MKSALKEVWILLLVGVLCIGLGIFMVVTNTQDLQRQTATTSATVLGYDEDWDAEGDISYYLHVRYQVGEDWYEGRYGQPYSKCSYNAGDEVKIDYNPSNPNDFSVSGDNRGFSGAAWMIPVGCILLVAAGITFVKKKKEAAKSEKKAI